MSRAWDKEKSEPQEEIESSADRSDTETMELLRDPWGAKSYLLGSLWTRVLYTVGISSVGRRNRV